MSVGRRPPAGRLAGEINQCQGRKNKVREGTMIPSLNNRPKENYRLKARAERCERIGRGIRHRCQWT